LTEINVSLLKFPEWTLHMPVLHSSHHTKKQPLKSISTTALRCVALSRCTARCSATTRCAARCRDRKNTNFQLIQWEAFPLQLRVALRCV